MKFLRTNRFTAISPALILALASLASHASAETKEEIALAALEQLSVEPRAPQPAELDEFGFHEATYLIDGLTRTKQIRLRDFILERRLRLPTNIAEALLSKNPIRRSGPGGR